MQRLIIGDIHGCYAELEELLDRAALGRGDEIIALGDLVDRGPDSPRVLAFFTGHPDRRAILGNHERKHIRSHRGEIRPALSQLIARAQFGEERYPEAVAAMDRLPRYIELEEAILVHGFLEPGVPLAAQRETVLAGTMSGEDHLRRAYGRPWYELYDREKPVLVGHLNYLDSAEPFIYRDRVFGLDTSCVNGKALTGLVLPGFRLVSAPARADHWSRMKHWYADVRLQNAPDSALGWEDLAMVLERLEGEPSPSPAATARAAGLRALLERGERALDELHARVVAENARVLGELRAEADFDRLGPAKQGSVYAARIGPTPLATSLHRARKGLFTRDGLRERFKTPAALLDFIERLAPASGGSSRSRCDSDGGGRG